MTLAHSLYSINHPPLDSPTVFMINFGCIKPGSQYDAGASVVSQASLASPEKTGVPVHNLAFASVGGVLEGVSEGGSL